MKQEPNYLRNIPVRRSARHQNKAPTDSLVKIEDGEEQKTRLKRRLHQLNGSSDVTDGSNSNEETLEAERERENNSLYCKTCNYIYESREVYLTHQIQVHWDEIPRNYCSFCERTLSTKNSQLKHLNTIHNMNIQHTRKVKIPNDDMTPDIYDENNFCNACGYTYASKRGYRIHLKVVHDMDITTLNRCNSDIIPDIYDENNFCSACDYTYSSRDAYRTHLFNVHTMVVPRKRSKKIRKLNPDKVPDIFDPDNFCKACDRIFASRYSYRNHLQRTHAITTKGQLKPRSFNRIPDINDPNNFCNVCDYTFSGKQCYQYHLTKIHSIKVPKCGRLKKKICYPDRIPDINDINNFCNMCDYTFSSKSSYLNHLVNIHSIKVPNWCRSRKNIPYPDRIPDINDPNNFCYACDHTFSSKYGYNYHLTHTHSIKVPKRCHVKIKIRYPERIPDINEPNNFCKACDHTFSSKQGYYYHLGRKHAIKVPKQTHSSKSKNMSPP